MKSLVFFILLIGVGCEDEKIAKQVELANLHIAKDLYEIIAPKQIQDFMFSPLGLLTVLSLLIPGADKNSAIELSKVSHLPTDNASLEAIHTYLSRTINNINRHNLNIANKIYQIGDENLKNEYLNNIAKLNVSVEHVTNYAQVPEDIYSKLILNRHEDNVQLVESTIDLLIANVIHLKAKWNISFEIEKSTYYMPSYSISNVEFLVANGNFEYFHDFNLDCSFLKIPFIEDVVLTIALPKSQSGIFVLEKHISSVLEYKPASLKHVHVNIPLRLASHMKINFKTYLETLGLKEAFTANRTFTQLSTVPLKINDIVQQAKISLNSSLVSVAVGTLTGENRIKRSSDVKFIANHPFIYYFTHKTLGILFIGRLYYPALYKSIKI